MSLDGADDTGHADGQHDLQQPDVLGAAADTNLDQHALTLPPMSRPPLSVPGNNRFGSGPVSALGLITPKVPVARKEEVQRLLGQVLVIKCDPSEPYLAPIVVMSSDETNIYTWLEKHLRSDYLMGSERFWKLVRSDMNLETWRPRVQGAQLKALNGARLPETTEELAHVENAIYSLQDCIKPESNPQMMMHDLKLQIFNIQTWWENRNKRESNPLKRPHGGPGSSAKRHASGGYDLGGGMGMGDQIPDFGALAANMDAGSFMDILQGLGGSAPDRSNKSWMPPPLPAYPGEGRAALAGVGSWGSGGSSSSNLVTLDVGGTRFTTSWHTLLAVPDSYFGLLAASPEKAHGAHKLPNGEYFIDRSGGLFHHVLEYLRACYHNEPTLQLPNDAREVQALSREAAFYQLPGLMEHIAKTSLMPQPGTRTYYDSLYLETGFKSIEGPSLKEMERCKVVVMQQMNHVLGLRAQEGFYVDQFECGVNHRQDAGSGTTEHNLYYNILLKRVVPLLPRGLLATNGVAQHGSSSQGGGEGGGLGTGGKQRYLQ